jgi:hypothetical protein
LHRRRPAPPPGALNPASHTPLFLAPARLLLPSHQWPAPARSGQGAALAGGTTFHIDFALPTGRDLLRGFEDYRAKAAAAAVMDYGRVSGGGGGGGKTPPSPSLTHAASDSFPKPFTPNKT